MFTHGRLLVIGVMLVLASPVVLADTIYQQPDDFVSQAFEGAPPKPRLLWLDAPAQQKLSAIFGHPYPQARLRYWRADGRTAWVLEDTGKEYPITAGFVIVQGRIDRASVLVYRETRGDEIHFPAFLRQFRGLALKDDGLSKEIDGISGATLSVWAMQRMARAALTLEAMAPP